MLFNSYLFILVFLPMTLLGCLALRQWQPRIALAYVSIASLVFYGYWEPKYLGLLLPSLAINYGLGRLIARTHSRVWLSLGVAGNLAVIGWFKYSLFLYLTVTAGGSAPDFLKGIVLPLGISFITFQKIAYLVDVWRGRHAADRFDRFAFFVLFFPQLIAGPIVLYRVMGPQIERWPARGRYLDAAFHIGLVFFAIGLFKKVVLADPLGIIANDVFEYAGTGRSLSFRDAWIGALTYSLQLYFDFSGYSDMALGMGRMFGFRLPVNFNSPYKASSIIDFWRRWHITLTRFFRDFVYIPLGGNRKGFRSQVLFILIVFFLTGLWHGAGWTFVVWGCLHGVLVVANHAWNRLLAPRLRLQMRERARVALGARIAGRAATLLTVVSLWVIFRAESWPVATTLLHSMYGFGPRTGARVFPDIYLYYVIAIALALLWGMVLAAPNSVEVVRHLRGWASRPSKWAIPSWAAAGFTGAALYFALASISKMQSSFIYFNF
jgi:D-alanyl-lipoteichoic acid acyltransferase DltB (MBOAT superfamily)